MRNCFLSLQVKKSDVTVDYHQDDLRCVCYADLEMTKLRARNKDKVSIDFFHRLVLYFCVFST